jgi:hypothetical protein
MMEQLTQLDLAPAAPVMERRRSPRWMDSQPFSIALTSGHAGGAASAGDTHKIVGHTRDLSEGGLGLILPSLPFVYRHLLSPDFKLRFTLDLPSGPVEIEATPTNDRPLNDSDADMHYMLSGELDAAASALFYGYGDSLAGSACILGVKITWMSDEHGAIYRKHLALLKAENASRAAAARAAARSAKSAGATPRLTRRKPTPAAEAVPPPWSTPISTPEGAGKAW